MRRRNFIRTGALSTIPIWIPGLKMNATALPFLFPPTDNDKILVLVQLNGGNDGLNCVIPRDQYSALNLLRPNILIPEKSVLHIEDHVGLHPSMTGMQNLYQDEKMTIIQAVGYPNQDRSHFRSTDIWTTGSDANEYLSTGWIGRQFSLDHPEYPSGYPAPGFEDPFALTMGSYVSETCQGPIGNFSLAVNDPFSLSPIPEGEIGQIPDTPYGDELRFIIDSLYQTNEYAGVIQQAAQSGSNQASYPDDNRLAQQLKNVALLISGGLKTKVYVVTLGGFDTHSGQVETDTKEGDHAQLLSQLSAAMEAFQSDLELSGNENRVVSMTFSEFGRQIRSNDSLGTDHGNAAPLFLFGSCVKHGVIGANPLLSVDSEPQAGVEMQVDFRSVYGTLLKDWLGLTEEEVYQVFYKDLQFLPLLNDCGVQTSTNDQFDQNSLVKVYPNPASSFVTITWPPSTDKWKIMVNNMAGKQVASWNGVNTNGIFQGDIHGLPGGKYLITILQGNNRFTSSFVKL